MNDPVVYRISHRFNFASANLVNAAVKAFGYRSYHFLTHPFAAFVPERSFFSLPEDVRYDEIPVETLREINRRLVMAKGGRDSAAAVFAECWTYDRPPPDLLVINQGSGISPDIATLFPSKPKTLFFAEYFGIRDFYPRPDWPMPAEMEEMDANYRKRAVAYAEACDAIVVPSAYAATLWPERFHHKIHPVFEGFDTDFLAPERILALSKYGPLLRRRLEGKRLVAFISETIEPIRGFDRWMQAYLDLRERFDDLHFIVLGQDRIKYGHIGGETYHGITSFKDWTLETLGLKDDPPDDISWLGMVPLYDYLSLLSALDVVIYPMYGMFSNWSLFHALHMGAPVVASDRAYLPEVVADGESGFLADPDDPKALADRAAAILESPETGARFRDRGRAVVEERFSMVATADRLAGLLRSWDLPADPAAGREPAETPPETLPVALFVAVEAGEAAQLAPLLDAVAGLEGTPPLFLADKTGDDRLEAVVAAHPNVVRRSFPPNTHKAIALNVLMQARPAELAVKLEPGTVLPGGDWLADLRARRAEDPQLVGGRLAPVPEREIDERSLGLQVDARGLRTRAASPVRIEPGLMVIADGVFEAAGYLHEGLAYSLHATEFSLRLQALGIEPTALAGA